MVVKHVDNGYDEFNDSKSVGRLRISRRIKATRYLVLLFNGCPFRTCKWNINCAERVSTIRIFGRLGCGDTVGKLCRALELKPFLVLSGLWKQQVCMSAMHAVMCLYN